MNKENKQPLEKLGYTQFDSAEIATYLNRLLSNYAIIQLKIKNFQRNLTGSDLFVLKNQFEKMYNHTIRDIEEISERIVFLEQTPVSTMSQYLELSKISEGTYNVPTFEKIKIVLHDMRIVLDIMYKTISAAREINDYGTEYMLLALIYRTEREHGLFLSWLKDG